MQTVNVRKKQRKQPKPIIKMKMMTLLFYFDTSVHTVYMSKYNLGVCTPQVIKCIAIIEYYTM